MMMLSSAPNGAWTWQSKGSAIRVSEDGTWDQKDSAETGREGSSQLFADGSWESKMKMGDGENFVHVTPTAVGLQRTPSER